MSTEKVEISSSELEELIKYLDKFRQDWTDLTLETRSEQEKFDYRFWRDRADKNRDIVIRMQDILWDLKRESMGLEKWHSTEGNDD